VLIFSSKLGEHDPNHDISPITGRAATHVDIQHAVELLTNGSAVSAVKEVLEPSLRNNGIIVKRPFNGGYLRQECGDGFLRVSCAFEPFSLDQMI